jgi:hypothetical protein
LRIQWTSKIVKSTTSDPKKTLVAFIKVTLLGGSRAKPDGHPTHSLKSLSWENFRWTGLGQKTRKRRKT